jgi:ubiquitin-protein ligase
MSELRTEEDQIKKNAEVLTKYTSGPIRRRVSKELEILYNLFAYIELSITNQGKLEIILYEIDADNKIQKYGFVLCNDYPFRSPAMFFQNKPYLHYLRINHTLSSINLVRRITGKDCFCCSSYNCGDNWGPGVTMKKIIDEMRVVKKQKRDILNKIIADVIKRKYLIDDIDLESWLF